MASVAFGVPIQDTGCDGRLRAYSARDKIYPRSARDTEECVDTVLGPPHPSRYSLLGLHRLFAQEPVAGDIDRVRLAPEEGKARPNWEKEQLS